MKTEMKKLLASTMLAATTLSFCTTSASAADDLTVGSKVTSGIGGTSYEYNNVYVYGYFYIHNGSNSSYPSVAIDGTIYIYEGGRFSVQSGVVTIENIVVEGGGSVTFSAGKTTLTNITSEGTITIEEGATVTIEAYYGGLVDLSSAIVNEGTLNLLGEGAYGYRNTFILNDSLADENGVYTLVTGSGTTNFYTLHTSDFIYHELELSAAHTGEIVTSGALSVTLVAADLVWTGDSSTEWTDCVSKNWQNKDGEADLFYNSTGDNVTFDNTSSKKTVSINETITAGTVTVSDKGYEFEFGENGSLTTGSLTVSGGGTLAITGDNALLDVTGSATVSGSLEVVDGAVSINKLIISEDATVSFLNGAVSIGEGGMSVGEGSTLILSVAISSEGDVEFNEGSMLVLSDEFLASALDTGDALDIIMANTIKLGSTTLTNNTTDIDKLLADYVYYSDDYTLTWSYEDGTLSATVTYLPEPSMFGMLLGLGAIGLVSIRRRRKSV